MAVIEGSTLDLAENAAKRRFNIVGIVLVSLAVCAATATFLVLTGIANVDPRPELVRTLLLTCTGFVIALVGLVGYEITSLVRARRRKKAGAALHIEIIRLFSIVAAMPAILVAVIALITLVTGLDNWISPRVRGIVNTAVTVARAYQDLQAASIQTATSETVYQLNQYAWLYTNDREKFRDTLRQLAVTRFLPGMMLMKKDGTVTDQVVTMPGMPLPMPPPGVLNDADRSDLIPILPGSKDVIGVVAKLSAFDDRYLFVVRPFDPKVAQYLRETEERAREYKALEDIRGNVQLTFTLMFLIIALIILLAAIWIGLAFSNTLVDPIRRLINAADQVSHGNLYVRVPDTGGPTDFVNLGHTFNNMTETLRSQRNELLGANDLLDSRRRFIEAVLSGVSTGVIGIDDDGDITVVNPLAERLLSSAGNPIGRPIVDLLPMLRPMVEDALQSRSRLVQGQVSLMHEGRERSINVKVTSEQTARSEHGYVVTLDDITELVLAQRTSAWADVARRIAHEIKNPLTPIQLSAERIRRKYGKVITEDREVFDQCTDTIVRQVDDIKRMVDEFSSFARMPKPAIGRDDIAEVVKQVVFMMRIGNPDIALDFTPPAEPLNARFDRRLISQAVTNVVKNATEAIAGVSDEERGQGKVEVKVYRAAGNIVVDVIDNGIGLPTESRQRLLEPYVTTREKGTGLGLAIVGKIMEDHEGGIELLDAPAVREGGRGALMRLWFPEAADDEAGAPTETAEIPEQ